MVCDAVGLTVVNECHHQERHQTTLHVVHVVPVAHPLLALTTHLALTTGQVALGHQCWPDLAKVVAEVLDDGARLGENDR